jgi:prephenate dehydrogenase
MMHFPKTTILGVGLLGASFGLAIKKHGLSGHITGHGRSRENLQRARERGIIDSFELDVADACRNADLILLATPVGSFADIVKAAAAGCKPGAIVTDVGSVKGKLVATLEGLMPAGVLFVGGHPIAGSDRSGIDAADAEIFRGAQCIITPTKNSAEDAVDAVTGLWTTFGSVISLIDPDEHDRIYAVVSHLPHLVAYEIVNTVADIDSGYLRFSGQGFRDTTRIALSHPDLWRDICTLNRENLLEAIGILTKNLEKASQYLRTCDSESLEKDFKQARTLREGLGQR